MSKNDLSYKKYSGSIEHSLEDECLHGRILYIDDIITYEGNTIPEIKAAFINAVDEYLDYCKKTGKPANKAYSGSFNVRVGSDLHKKASTAARQHGLNLNEYVAKAIEICVDHNGLAKVEHTHNHKITIESIGPTETHVATISKPSAWGEVNATKH